MIDHVHVWGRVKFQWCLLCATSVLSVFLWFTLLENHHGDTERTQRLHREDGLKTLAILAINSQSLQHFGDPPTSWGVNFLPPVSINSQAQKIKSLPMEMLGRQVWIDHCE